MLALCYYAELKKRHIDTPLDQITLERIAKVVRWLREGQKPGLLLCGTIGNGKTTMCNAVCELIGIIHDSGLKSECKAVKRVTASALVEMKLKNEEGFESYKTAEMLFIDELGAENVSVKSWGNELTPIIDLLSYRHDHQLFTMVTTNYDMGRIDENYGPRIADRLKEMCDLLAYVTSSYRK